MGFVTDRAPTNKELTPLEVINLGGTDFIKDGKLYRFASAQCVMVTSEDDLAQLPEIYDPGTVAYTAGFVEMWQLDASGDWVEIR